METQAPPDSTVFIPHSTTFQVRADKSGKFTDGYVLDRLHKGSLRAYKNMSTFSRVAEPNRVSNITATPFIAHIDYM
jgi:hypothetical protein